MKTSAFITITRPKERGDLYIECLEAAYEIFDEVIVVDGEDTWPKEFDWPLIGQHFQKGYEAATGDWVVHLDTDFILHENDKQAILNAFKEHSDAPALSFWKYQFILPDRYSLKSRLVIAVNKAKYGDRIRFDSGGDLCQPSLDGKELKPDQVPEARVPFYNYEKILKTEAQIKDDVGRMARAWERHFGEAKLGSDDESAYREWLKMTVGRFGKAQEKVALSFHPEVMQKTIEGLRPDQFGYNGLGHLEDNMYV